MTDYRFTDAKADAHPEDEIWDEVTYSAYVRQCIENGLKDVDEGRVVDVDNARRMFGLRA